MIKNKKIDFRNAVFDQLIKIAVKKKNIFIITADISAYSLEVFKKKFKKNFFNIGITEQSMVAIACGMAMSKQKKIFAFSMIPFLTMRAYEHIKVDISSTGLPVTLIGLGSGLSFSTDGPSAHGTTDIALIRALPNFKIFNPSDPTTAMIAAKESYKSKTPSYIRLDKSQQVKLYDLKNNFSQGYIETKTGSKIFIVSTGIMVQKAFEIKKILKEKKKEISIIDMFRLKPVSEIKLIKSFLKYDKIIILDENTIFGGLVPIVTDLIARHKLSKEIKIFSLPDTQCFNYGDRNWLHKKYKIDNKSVINYILR